MAYKIWIENARRRELAVVSGRANADTIGQEIGARVERLYAVSPGDTGRDHRPQCCRLSR